ncbi:hypothetical protein MARCHEWKA_04140 [Brevundimonas phage vB_BpoS-Marchewka]|uniref:DUF1937 domain-containing protein n=1 Tax=Brevundimonas phage vB_BpoS-Marchewka TaxID=2948604 RepID=A0A9E7SSL1_9CAUD|nr:hypothetical protein MARCHEWKA_04140 [Brevundimonas phage vB_BpoS-Marchewka]UTC29370.1 hypothetical protein BAMBUS_02880 [Brevundimonas phage vB_BpoS-Bambus]
MTDIQHPTSEEIADPFFARPSPSASLVYVAAPYSDPDPLIVAARMSAFDKTVADMLTAGDTFPVSPLMNHAILGKHKIPGNWEFWQHYSRRLLARCDAIVVIDMPGAATSEGVRGEIDLARSLHLPVSYVPMDQAAFDDGAVAALSREWPMLRGDFILKDWIKAGRDPVQARELVRITRWS